MTWSDGGIRPFQPDLIPAGEYAGDSDVSNGLIIVGSKGVMTCGTYGTNPRVYTNAGAKIEMTQDDKSPANLPEYGHNYAWTEACKAGFDSYRLTYSRQPNKEERQAIEQRMKKMQAEGKDISHDDIERE